MAVVDCFPFFAPYNEELLYLRVNLLKDHVDKFIIVESNKTHAGEPVERKFMEIARKQGLPMEKIIYVEHDIPEEDEIEILKLDRRNAGENAGQRESVYARARERLQKDAVMSVMDQFKDNDVFIYGDCDEIIKPQNVKWLANMQRMHQDITLKVPLVYLQGRADLRIHHKNDGGPVKWLKAMFFATKKQIMKYSVNRLRCGATDLPVRFPTHNNQLIQDMGWHFAWVGSPEQRNIKAKSFAHAYDKFKWMDQQGMDNGYADYIPGRLAEGEPAPDGNENHVLKRYPHEELPQMIFEVPMLKNFLLPDTDMEVDYNFNVCRCFWCTKLDFPLLYNLDGEQYWFEVPRSCSVTIKESFPNRKQVFRDQDEYDEANQPIMIFTDPIDRFISCINGYLTKGQRYYSYGHDIFSAFGKDLNTMEKEEKIEWFFKNLDKVTSQHQVHHFHPQARFVDTDRFKKITVVKREDVNDFFGINEKMNETVKEITKEDFSEQQIDFIKRIYKEDYEFLKKYGKS